MLCFWNVRCNYKRMFFVFFKDILRFCLFVTVPAAGFTQRATLDPETDEIHVLSVSFLLFKVILFLFGNHLHQKL